MLKLGVLDFDTSHVIAFTERLNQKSKDMDQWVDGARVVIGCPGESKIMPERIPGYVEAMKKMEVPLVEKPEEMIGKVDGMLIESQEGGAHWSRAKPFLEAGIPCFVDKPFTCSVEDAKRFAEVSAKKNVGVFTASSLRYAPEVINFAKDMRQGNLHGVVTYGPAPLFEKDARLNPGLYHYGIHAVEILYTLMGPGCQRVTCTHEKGVDVVNGQWNDGRVATVRGIRAGKQDYGFVAFTDRGVTQFPASTKYTYRDLVRAIVTFFTTKKSPVELSTSVEMMAFIESANRSGANHGSVEKLATA